MLVRAQSVILWNPFLSSQPINSTEEQEQEEDLINTTCQQDNITIMTRSPIVRYENGMVTDISSTTINVSLEESSNLLVVEVDEEEQRPEEDNNIKKDVGIIDGADSSLAAADHDMHSSVITTNNKLSSVLLDKPIPTYFNGESDTANDMTLERDSDGLIYYKRREDYYPQPSADEEEEESLSSPASINPQQQIRRQSIHHVLGKSATRVHPNEEGMPIFKSSASDHKLMIKPKTMLKRFKTMVKNTSKKKRSSSSATNTL